MNIQEIIPVGSGKEDTQIIRPCEFDYILILRALSIPGAVSITPANPEDKRRVFMHVKLEDDDVRSIFHEFSDDDYLRGSHWLPWYRQGLRELFLSAVNQSVVLNSRATIKLSTGQLKMRRWKPKSHGPAFMIRLVWERKTKKKYTTMEISVDLCPALKLDIEPFKNVLPPFDPYYLDFIDNIQSVLLMPREGHLFKVTYTEFELLCTSHLSQHHRKCYKLLKYLLNGEPFPRETPTNRLITPFMDSKTVFHSYALKTLVWTHHYLRMCNEKADLGSCISKILNDLRWNRRRAQNPFVGDWTTFENVSYDTSQDERPSKESLSTLRLKRVLKGIERVKQTPNEGYNFEMLCRAIEFRGLGKCPAKTRAKIAGAFYSMIVFLIGLGWFSHSRPTLSKNKPMMAIGAVLYLCSIVCFVLTPGVSYFKRHVLAMRSYKCKVDKVNLSIFYFYVLLYITGIALLITSAPGWQSKLIFGLFGGLCLPFQIFLWGPRHLCDCNNER